MKTNILKAKQTRIITLVFYLLSPGGLLLPITAIADAITDAAIAGQNAAKDILNGASTGSLTGNDLTITDQNGNTSIVTTQDLFQTQNVSAQQQTNFTTTTTTYGDDAALTAASGAYSAGNTTSQDFAFEVVNLGKTRSHPDMRNDPIWGLTDSTMSSLASLQASFSDCSVDTIFVDASTTGHISDIQRCDRTYVPQTSCTVTHPYDAKLLSLVNNNNNAAGAYSSCGPGCYDLWVGKVGDNYWGGYCTIYEQDTAVRVLYPDAIISATLVQALWDDYIQIYVSGNKIYNGPNQNFPPETAGGCELGTSWNINPNIDVTSHFKNTPANDVLQFKTRVSVAGNGEGYSRIRIYYDTSKILQDDIWDPQQCIDDYNHALNSSFCTQATATCTVQKNTTTYTNAEGITFDTNSLAPSPITGISNLCQEVDVVTQCDFASGNLQCYVDIAGNTICPTSTTTAAGNGCVTQENDPNCAFIKSECVNGAFDVATNTCMVTEDTYDCGYDVNIPSQTTQDQFNCTGPVRCMGTECILDTQEGNEDFAKTAATLEAIKFMAMDQVCNVSAATGGGPGTDCTIFQGQVQECRKAVGGTANCCEKPSGISMADYLQMMYGIYSLDQAAGMMGDGNGYILGTYNLLLSDQAAQTWNTISSSDAWTSAMDTIFGGGATSASAAQASGSVAAEEAVMTQLEDDMMARTANWVSQNFGPDVAGLLFEQNAQTGATELGGTIGGAASFVMAAYMYYQLTVLAIQMIYECTEEEYELNVKRALQSAHFIGSYCKQQVLGQCLEVRETYCTYSSPVARILSQQIKPTVPGLDFGTPEAPNCDGLSLNDMANVDWSQVDLSEWEAILADNDILPKPSDITLESVTGAGNEMNIYGDRDNTLERVNDRINTSDPENVRENVRQSMW